MCIMCTSNANIVKPGSFEVVLGKLLKANKLPSFCLNDADPALFEMKLSHFIRCPLLV